MTSWESYKEKITADQKEQARLRFIGYHKYEGFTTS